MTITDMDVSGSRVLKDIAECLFRCNTCGRPLRNHPGCEPCPPAAAASPLPASHCWHSSRFVSTFHGSEEMCCHCGSRRQVYHKPPAGHGIYVRHTVDASAGEKVYTYVAGADPLVCAARKG